MHGGFAASHGEDDRSGAKVVGWAGEGMENSAGGRKKGKGRPRRRKILFSFSLVFVFEFGSNSCWNLDNLEHNNHSNK